MFIAANKSARPLRCVIAPAKRTRRGRSPLLLAAFAPPARQLACRMAQTDIFLSHGCRREAIPKQMDWGRSPTQPVRVRAFCAQVFSENRVCAKRRFPIGITFRFFAQQSLSRFPIRDRQIVNTSQPEIACSKKGIFGAIFISVNGPQSSGTSRDAAGALLRDPGLAKPDRRWPNRSRARSISLVQTSRPASAPIREMGGCRSCLQATGNSGASLPRIFDVNCGYDSFDQAMVVTKRVSRLVAIKCVEQRTHIGVAEWMREQNHLFHRSLHKMRR